jgi:hypothetical protein
MTEQRHPEGPPQRPSHETREASGRGQPPEGHPSAPEHARPPASPGLHLRDLGWFVRAVSVCAIAATVLGVLVAPGLHGNAADATVNTWDRASAVFAYAMAILLTVGIAVATAEIVFSRRAETVAGALIVGGSSLVLVLLVMASSRDAPPPEQVTLGFAVVGSAVASTAGFVAVRSPQTRALAIVVSAFALAAVVRVGAWEMARVAGDRANASLYMVSRGVSTAGSVIEALGQLAAAVWIGTRGRLGLVLSSVAALGAFAITWYAAQGGRPDADHWASVLHASLAEASTLPAPYALSGAASFLVASGTLLAAAAVVQVGQPAAIVSALALALISRGALDAPLRAVAMVAAAQWAVVAAFDDRLLWASLAASGRKSPRPPAAP